MIWKLFTFHPSAYIMLIVTEGIMCETDTRIQISSNLTPQFRLYVFVCVRDSMRLCEWVYAREGVRACVRARARVCVCVCVCMCVYVREFVCWLVGILSRVNHKGLQHGYKQCSICLLFTLHASHQTKSYSKTTKSVLTQVYMKNIHKHQTQHFRRITPFGITPVKKKHKRLGHAGIVDHSVDLSIPDF